MEFKVFTEGMDYATLNPPTTPDILFVFNRFTVGVPLSMNPTLTAVDCLETGIFPEGVIRTIKQATIFVDISR